MKSHLITFAIVVVGVLVAGFVGTFLGRLGKPKAAAAAPAA